MSNVININYIVIAFFCLLTTLTCSPLGFTVSSWTITVQTCTAVWDWGFELLNMYESLCCTIFYNSALQGGSRSLRWALNQSKLNNNTSAIILHKAGGQFGTVWLCSMPFKGTTVHILSGLYVHWISNKYFKSAFSIYTHMLCPSLCKYWTEIFNT